jgi:hypothetical protein
LGQRYRTRPEHFFEGSAFFLQFRAFFSFGMNEHTTALLTTPICTLKRRPLNEKQFD